MLRSRDPTYGTYLRFLGGGAAATTNWRGEAFNRHYAVGVIATDWASRIQEPPD
jgi:hypothetical protein